MLQKGDEPVPGYRLEEFLGRGQFGEVWRATSPGRASVALKFLNLSEKQGWKEFRAIQSVKSIRHPHLAPITALWLLDQDGHVLNDDVVESIGTDAPTARHTLVPDATDSLDAAPQRLVVATLLCDKNLLNRLEECQRDGQEGIPQEELLRFMEEAAKGIDFLNSPQHQVGSEKKSVQHCDIKPENIMLTGDSVMICDFGVARVMADAQTVATGTSMAGSPAYMAPECIARRPSAASDQYSLAVSYVELRTGKLPFASESYFEVIDAHRTGNLELSMLTPGEQEVIRKATSLEPEKRYPSTVAMVRALRRAIELAEGGGDTAAIGGGKTALVAACGVAAVLLLGWLLRETIWAPTPPPPERLVRIHVEPLGASVMVDGETMALDNNGWAELQRPEDATLSIVASHPPEFVEQRREVAVAEVTERGLRFTLERGEDYTPQAFANRAYARIEQESFDDAVLAEAVHDFVRAIELEETTYAVKPFPEYLAQAGEGRRGLVINCLAVSGDSRYLAARTGDDFRKIVVWDLLQPKERPRELHAHNSAAINLAFVGDFVASADVTEAVLLSGVDDANRSSSAITPETLRAFEMLGSPDGRWLLAGDIKGQLWRWDMTDLAANSELLLGQHTEMIEAIAFSTDSRWAYTGSPDGVVKRWNLTDTSEMETKFADLDDGDVVCVVVSPNGKNVAIAEEGKGAEARHRVVVVNAASPGTLRELRPLLQDRIESLRYDGESRWLAGGTAEGDIYAWKNGGATPRILTEVHQGPVRTVAFAPFPGWLVSGGDDGKIALWNLDEESDSPLVLDPQAGPVMNVACTERWIIAGTKRGGVILWKLRRCMLIKRSCDEKNLTPRDASTGGQIQT